MRHPIVLGLLFIGLLPAGRVDAVDRIELSVGRIDAGTWQARDLGVDWRVRRSLRLSAGELTHPQLPGPLQWNMTCLRAATTGTLECAGGTLDVDAPGPSRLRTGFDLRYKDSRQWDLRLRDARLELTYDRPDGSLAAEGLTLELSGHAEQRAGTLRSDARIRSVSGQAYIEPVFVDFGAHPATLDLRLQRAADGTVRIERAQLRQSGVGTLALSGSVDPASPTQRHELDLDVRSEQAGVASGLYLKPLLAASAVQGAELHGGLALRAAVRDGAPTRLQLDLAGAALTLPGYGLHLDGLDGILHWQAQAAAPASSLRWTQGSIGQVPVGPAQLQFVSTAGDFRLDAPLRVPLLGGALNVATLNLRGLGGPQPGAEFAAEIEPIDLALLCRSLGWPQFGGSLSGRLPGLSLQDRRLQVDGTLTAEAFGGTAEVGGLEVIDPFGVLPRIAADIRLRRLDLAALTGTFDFGRIEGRLNGDVEGLRLIGWEPVAMHARLYSTPGDRSRKRISQRAIDSISAVGGGPTGLLSRGVMSLFRDFAYARIGWSCRLANGVCAMDGVKPAGQGNGYVLVQGAGLPRIDVVGYSQQVSWPVFMAQLRSVAASGPAEVRP